MRIMTFSIGLALVLSVLSCHDKPCPVDANAQVPDSSPYLASLPPFAKHPHECDWLNDGETYRLRWKGTHETETVPKALWVHKVTRFIPPLQFEKAQELARSLGFTNRLVQNASDNWFTREGEGMFSYRKNAWTVYAGYDSPKTDWVESELFYKRHDNFKTSFSAAAMYEMGREELRRIGVWPSNISTNYLWYDIVTGQGGQPERFKKRCFSCRGELEGYDLSSPECQFRFEVIFTGEFRRFRIGWRETERFVQLATRTVKEAFDDLNRGYALPLPKKVRGCTAQYQGICYIMGLPAFEFVYPFYIFELKSRKIEAFEAYVPAVRSGYFQNPKRQVIFLEEESRK